jgi:hypothetical protein
MQSTGKNDIIEPNWKIYSTSGDREREYASI